MLRSRFFANVVASASFIPVMIIVSRAVELIACKRELLYQTPQVFQSLNPLFLYSDLSAE